MIKLFNLLLNHLGRPNEQVNDKVALVVVLSIFLSFTTVVIGGYIVFVQVNQMFVANCKVPPTVTSQLTER